MRNVHRLIFAASSPATGLISSSPARSTADRLIWTPVHDEQIRPIRNSLWLIAIDEMDVALWIN